MTIKSHNLLSFSLFVALPFLGGVTECAPAEPEPEPEPEPTLCFADADCGAGEICNTDLCLSPCRDGEACPAVCYGACEPAPPPDLCLADADCGPGARCDTSVCMGPPCGDDGTAHLTVCYGVCTDLPPVCEPVLCDLACERFARDERGCEICACEEPPPPPPACEDVICALYCEHGFNTDERGCPVCECAPPPACEPVACDLWCENGFQTDERGCEICACNPTPGEGLCGGFAGFSCTEDEWCDYDADVPACGAADHLGTCRPRPEACIEIYAPVCGCDGSSYPNECFAHAAGVDTWASGLCAPPEPSR